MQSLCPLHCDHGSDDEWLFAVKSLMSGGWAPPAQPPDIKLRHRLGTDWERTDIWGICWIYGVKSLTLVTDTFSLLSTKMSTADCKCCFFLPPQIKNKVLFLGSAGADECDHFCAKRDT